MRTIVHNLIRDARGLNHVLIEAKRRGHYSVALFLSLTRDDLMLRARVACGRL